MTKPLYVQLWTLRNELEADYDGTINAVADIGFVGVEPIDLEYMKIPASRQVDTYKSKGLSVLSFHCKGSALFDETLHELIKKSKAYGAKYIITAMPPQEGDFASLQNISKLALAYNRVGAIAAEHGLKVGHHNHDGEMQKIDGRPAIEYFLDQIDENVIVELDTYWAKVGNADPVAILKKYQHKIPLIHIKDGPCVKGSPNTPFGKGKFEIEEVVKAAVNAEAFVVELDNVLNMTLLEAARKSYHYMIEKGFARGQ